MYRVILFRRALDEDTGVAEEFIQDEEAFSHQQLNRHIQRLQRKLDRWKSIRTRINAMDAAGDINVEEPEP